MRRAEPDELGRRPERAAIERPVDHRAVAGPGTASGVGPTSRRPDWREPSTESSGARSAPAPPDQVQPAIATQQERVGRLAERHERRVVELRGDRRSRRPPARPSQAARIPEPPPAAGRRCHRLDERMRAARRSRSPRPAAPSRARVRPEARRAASGTAMPSTPMSASAAHTWSTRVGSAPRAGPLADSSGQAARTTSAGHSLASRSRTASRNASWSSLNAKRTGYFLGRPRTRSAAMLRWISFVPA